MIVNLKVVLGEFLSQANLTQTETLHVYETTQVVIVGEDKILVFVAF